MTQPVPASGATLSDRLISALTQYPLPHQALTRLMYLLTRARWPVWKNWQIRWFIERYHVDMSLAAEPNALTHPDFNSFFTRALKPDARPVVSGEGEIACPVDGAVSQARPIVQGRIFQAKGHDYSVETLLAGRERAALFEGGSFATLYLSPRDYHRIHMPMTGRLTEMVYVPGRLFSVNPRTTRCVPGLFARNERVVTLFDTACGPMAVVMVGAMFVAGIETVWDGNLCDGEFKLREWDFRNHTPPCVLERGAELGRFNMGSTVIVLFARDRVALAESIKPDASVCMGQLLARAMA